MVNRRKSGTFPWKEGLLVALALGLSVLGGVWLWQSSVPAERPPAEVAVQEPAEPSAQITEAVKAEPKVAEEPQAGLARTPRTLEKGSFAPSLEGTEIDGHLRADAQGNLVLELEVKDFFDYFLSTVGEMSPEDAIAQIQSLAGRHLPEAAAQQAEALLEDYLTFKQKAFEYTQQPLAHAEAQTPEYQLAQLEKAQAALQRIRRDTMAPEAVEAFFGLEEAYGDFTLATIKVHQRNDLSAQQKQQMIEYHRSQLPPILRRSHERVSASAARAANVEAVIQSSSSPEIARGRLQEMGLAEAHIEEIVTVLQSEESFERQYADYRQERQALARSGLAGEDRERAEAALQERYFRDEQQQTWARLRDLGEGKSEARPGATADANQN